MTVPPEAARISPNPAMPPGPPANRVTRGSLRRVPGPGPRRPRRSPASRRRRGRTRRRRGADAPGDRLREVASAPAAGPSSVPVVDLGAPGTATTSSVWPERLDRRAADRVAHRVAGRQRGGDDRRAEHQARARSAPSGPRRRRALRTPSRTRTRLRSASTATSGERGRQRAERAPTASVPAGMPKSSFTPASPPRPAAARRPATSYTLAPRRRAEERHVPRRAAS